MPARHVDFKAEFPGKGNPEEAAGNAAERAFLAALDGSCETPIAALAELDGGTLRLRGEILRPDGSESLSDDQTAPIEDGAKLGRDMAARLLERAGEGFFDWRS